MTLKKNEAPDWAAAGLDRVGGPRPPRVPQLVRLEEIDLPPDVKLAFDKIKEATESGVSIDEVLKPPLNVTPPEIQKAIDKVAQVKVEGESILQSLAKKKFAELRSDLFDVRKDLEDLRHNYRHNLLRVFAAGALVAWFFWTIVGGPS